MVARFGVPLSHHESEYGMVPEHNDDFNVIQWINDHEKRHITLDEILARLMNRLPLWATAAATLGGTLFGILVTIIVVLANLLSKT